MECRQRIIDAAADFFTRIGIKAVTMDFLAEHLGISKRTIYEIFQHKNNLIRDSISFINYRHHIEIKSIIDHSTDVIQAFYTISNKSYELYNEINPLFFHDLKKYYPDIFSSLFKKGDLDNSSISLTLLKKGIREGVFDHQLNIEIVNKVWQELIFMMHEPEKFNSRNMDRDELFRNIIHPFFKGLCTRKGLKLIDKYSKTDLSGVPNDIYEKI